MWKLCSDDEPRESEMWKSWINIYQFKTSIHPLQDKVNVEKRNVCIYDPHTEKNMNNKDNQFGLQTK